MQEIRYLKLEVRGLVQGVNFRETIRQLAYKLKLNGYVKNDINNTNLVYIEVEGEKKNLDTFVGIIQDMKIKEYKDGEILGTKSHIDVERIQIIKVEDYPYSNQQKYEGKGFIIKIEEKKDTMEQIAYLQTEILKKLTYGGQVYKDFHNDHNNNFQLLNNKFGDISKEIQNANTELKRIGDVIGKYLSEDKK